jgi:hypothetical protein
VSLYEDNAAIDSLAATRDEAQAKARGLEVTVKARGKELAKITAALEQASRLNFLPVIFTIPVTIAVQYRSISLFTTEFAVYTEGLIF